MASFQNLCRLCTKNTNSTLCLNHTDADKVKYIDKLKFIFNDLILEEDSKTSFRICPTCSKKLKQTYDFKKQCASSYEYWQLHFLPNKTVVKKEPNLEEKKTKSEEIPKPTRKRGRPRKVTTENPLIVTSLKNKLGSVLKTNSSEANPNILNLKNKLTTLLKPDIQIKKEVSNKVATPIQLSFTSLKSKLGDALKIGIQNFEDEKLSPVIKPIIKKPANEKYYVYIHNQSFYIIDIKRGRFYCKSCNKYFLNFKSLKIHIVQDLGIKNVPCRLCRKRFFSRRELKLHTQKHK